MDSAAGTGGTELVVHAGPVGEAPAALARVFVNEQEVFVHHALVRAKIERYRDKLWGHEHSATGERAGFVLFDFAGGPVQVRVQWARPCQIATLHPLSAGIAAAVEGDTIRFAMDRPGKLTLRVDGQWTDALHFFCSTPEQDVPRPGDPGVIYFGPGVHCLHHLEIPADTTVYLAPGALLRGELGPDEPMTYNKKWNITTPAGGPLLRGRDAGRIRIRGRGIIDSSAIPHVGLPTIVFQHCTDVAVEGIVIRDASAWNVTFRDCDRATARDVKIISARLNSDGINSVGSRQVRIADCFVRNRDDSFAVKTMTPGQPAGDIVVENSVIWNDWGFAAGVTYETCEAIGDVTFRDLDVLHCEHWALGIHAADSGTVSDIHFRDIRIEHAEAALLRLDVIQDKWSRQEQRGRIRRVVVRDISYAGAAPPPSTIAGHDAEHDIDDVLIRNLVINGQVVTTPAAARLTINEHARRVRFEA